VSQVSPSLVPSPKWPVLMALVLAGFVGDPPNDSKDLRESLCVCECVRVCGCVSGVSGVNGTGGR